MTALTVQRPRPGLDSVLLSIDGSTVAMAGVVADLVRERVAQQAKWGQQDHEDGTGWPSDHLVAVMAKAHTDRQAELGSVTWRTILDEEVAEAFAESDPAKLRAELVQVAAVAVAWVEAIDRRAPVD